MYDFYTCWCDYVRCICVIIYHSVLILQDFCVPLSSMYFVCYLFQMKVQFVYRTQLLYIGLTLWSRTISCDFPIYWDHIQYGIKSMMAMCKVSALTALHSHHFYFYWNFPWTLSLLTTLHMFSIGVRSGGIPISSGWTFFFLSPFCPTTTFPLFSSKNTVDFYIYLFLIGKIVKGCNTLN